MDGNTIKTKQPKIDCKSDLWVEDFYKKYHILKSLYEESFQEDLYVDIYGGLDKKCNLRADGMKHNGILFDSLLDYVQDYKEVFIYPQDFEHFFKGMYNNRSVPAVKSFKCFVVDIDNVPSNKLMEVISRINKVEIKPNYIVSTGYGLHLYFIFNERHYMKGSIGILADFDDKSLGKKCYIQNMVYDEELYKRYTDIYYKIKLGIIGWYSNVSTTFADTQNHLAQPMRLYGAKTRNPECYTQIFKVTEKKYSFQDIALLFDVELPSEEEIRSFVRVCNSYKSMRYRTKKKKEKIEEEKILALTNISLTRPIFVGPKKYYCNFNPFIKKMSEEELEYLESDEYKLLQKYNSDQIIKRHQRELEWKQRKEERGSNANLAYAQQKGLQSQYLQFKKMIMDNGHKGNRRDSLYVFWHRAHKLCNDESLILNDCNELVVHFNCMSVNDPLTDQQIDSIIQSKPHKYGNNAIETKIGLVVKYERKQEKQRIVAKEITKSKRQTENLKIIEIAEFYFSNTLKPSYRGLETILKHHGISKSFKTLSSMVELRDIKAKHTS